MPPRNRHRPLIALALLVVLSGCTPTVETDAEASASTSAVPSFSSPTSPSDSPTPTRSVAPETIATPPASAPPAASEAIGPTDTDDVDLSAVDRIQLHAQQIVLLDGPEAVTTLPLDDADAIVAALTRVLGEPRVEEIIGAGCLEDTLDYRWSDAMRVFDFIEAGHPISDVRAIIDAPNVLGASGSPVSLEGPSGVYVDGDIVTLIGDTPAERKVGYQFDTGTDWAVLLQQGSQGGGSLVGVIGYTTGTVLRSIQSPDVLEEDFC